MMSPDSVLSLEAEEEAGGEVFQVINAHLRFFPLSFYTLQTSAFYTLHLHFTLHVAHLHYLLHIARFHSVCTGYFIVHSTILSVWYRITVLHIKLKYTVLHRITLHLTLHYTTLKYTALHCTALKYTTPHRMICSPQCFRLQVSWGFRPRLSSTPTTPTLSSG